jgi:hypothetical protein
VRVFDTAEAAMRFLALGDWARFNLDQLFLNHVSSILRLAEESVAIDFSSPPRADI